MGGEDDRKQASVRVFSEGLQSVDSHLAGGPFYFFFPSSSVYITGFLLHYRSGLCLTAAAPGLNCELIKDIKLNAFNMCILCSA